MISLPNLRFLLQEGFNSLAPLRPAELCYEEHLRAAIDWIQQAHTAAHQRGISKGYDLLRDRWSPAYPETTGYTIPTLLNAARRLDQAPLETLGITLADFLLECATPEGGVVHWGASASTYPIVFDTGQVIFGWLAAYDASADPRYLQAAEKAGDWLIAIQDPSGAWVEHQYLGVQKVIDTRVAWALLELEQRSPRHSYRVAAQNNLEWALRQQNAAGWFAHCAFVDGADPFTHTLAYTAEGLYECGRLLGNPGYIQAAQRMADALLAVQRPNGALASTYGSDWRETDRSSCLTGNCQMSRLWLCLYEQSGDERYYQAAHAALAFVAATQRLEIPIRGVRGGIAGSYPVSGAYERFKYPNWATKFYIDTLLAMERADKRGIGLHFVG